MRRLLKIVSIIAVVLIGLLIMGVLLSDTTAQPVQKVYTPEQLLKEANKLRAEKSVAPLRIDERLNQSAQWKADDMRTYNYLGHVRDGYHGYMKAGELTPECLLTSENYEFSNTTASPFDWWVTSESHYEAIVNSTYDITGFGYALVGDKYTYVQHFCDLE